MCEEVSQLLLDKERTTVRKGQIYVTSQTRKAILCDKDRRTSPSNFTIIR